jgi:hypothetical protein
VITFFIHYNKIGSLDILRRVLVKLMLLPDENSLSRLLYCGGARMLKPLIVFCLSILVSLPSIAASREELLEKAKSMSKDEVWEALTKTDAAGNTMFGKCRVASCSSGCACGRYFKGWNVAQPGALDVAGQYGWPKNYWSPGVGASSGCMDSCWDGMDAATMCTSDIKANAKAVLINALDNSQHKYSGYSDVCGVGSLPPAKKVSISIMDSSKLYFIKPSEPCTQGKVMCGTTSIGDKVGEYESFNKLPDQFCAAAYGVIKSSLASYKQQGKADVKDSRFITCAQYSQKQIASETLSQAKSVLGDMNTKFAGCDIIPYCEYSPIQMDGMTVSEVALFYVVLGERVDSMPATIKPKIAALTSAQLGLAREAYKELLEKLPSTNGGTYTLEDALKKIAGK